MSERAGYTPEDEKDKGMTRRDFLKKLGIAIAAPAALGGAIVGGEALSRNRAEEVLSGPRKERKVEKGDTVWGYYEESGYTGFEEEFYEEAFYKINKNIKPGTLPENAVVMFPYKGEE